MKKIFLIFLFLIPFLKAIPNPSAVYCTSMNYTYDNGTCFFPDGVSCDAFEFFNGTCGADYIKELPCVNESGAVFPPLNCCEGLEKISKYSIVDGDCQELLGEAVCSNCGNGVCEDWENYCSCPSDCQKTCEDKCGDGVCDENSEGVCDENRDNCPSDCRTSTKKWILIAVLILALIFIAFKIAKLFFWLVAGIVLLSLLIWLIFFS